MTSVGEPVWKNTPGTPPPRTLEAKGIRILAFHDLGGDPGFKLALQRVDARWYLYTAHLWRSGWSVLDVTDPAAPEHVALIPGPPHTWTLQVQAANGKLITSLERPPEGWGIDRPDLAEEGVLIWDIAADPVAPKLLGVHRTGGSGTHRNFYARGDLAYLAAGLPGVPGRALQIVDISDPKAPREVARWCWPGQDDPDAPKLESYMHGPAYVDGDLAYVSFGRAGLVVLDVSAPERPTMVGHLGFGDLGSRVGCHSAVPLSGRPILIVNSEALVERPGPEWNYAFVVDISDPSVPVVVGQLPEPVAPAGRVPYHARNGRFGPHNQHHQQGHPDLLSSSDIVYMTWFNAGLRIFDVSDPAAPHETAHYLPVDPVERRGPLPTHLSTQFEDVLVDARGVIYCSDKNHGVFVLERSGV